MTRAPELILLDLQMPSLDGYEECRRLKADPATREIPVIVISALDDVADKVRAFEAGAVDYVTKPFQAPEVLSRVGAHLQLFRLRRELARQQEELARQNRELVRKNQELEQAQRRTERVFSALSSALPGTVLDGKYRLDEQIGAGGVAAVFRAQHLGLERPVAVKVFRPWPGNETPEALESFRLEGVSSSRFSHPNAVSVLDFGVTASGIAYLVMELLRGFTLRELVRQQGAVPLARCVEIMLPVCRALAEAHAAGIVHRDVKPENVFLHQTPRGEVVKVLDFGIAKLLADAEQPDVTQSRGLVGTPFYLAPERVKGEAYDGRSDVYSVGIILYALLSGRMPFPFARDQPLLVAACMHVNEVPAPLPDPVPEAAARLVMRALVKDPAQRPGARELADGLAALL
jgi:serine/threonine protein kinase